MDILFCFFPTLEELPDEKIKDRQTQEYPSDPGFSQLVGMMQNEQRNDRYQDSGEIQPECLLEDIRRYGVHNCIQSKHINRQGLIAKRDHRADGGQRVTSTVNCPGGNRGNTS